MPKRLTILALGSRGDVQPYLALGKGLKAAGNLVRIVTFESFRELIEGHGLEFHSVPGDAQDLLVAASSTNALRTQNPFAAMRAIMKSYGALVESYISAFSSERLFDSDAILNQLPGSLFGVDLAEKLRIPHFVVSVIPLTITGAFPNPLLSTRSFGSAMNRFTYVGAAQLLWAFFRPHIAKFRKKLGLNAPSLLLHQPNSLIINGFSPLVVPPPLDWASTVYTTGYWLLDETEWCPPVSLLDFLEAGEPPVFFGFGSMIAPDPAQLTQTILDAIQQSGHRAILSSGWAGIGNAPLPNSVFRLGYSPYAWLFPRMSAIVHHGGSGTTGLALRSGVPSMVIPFGADQPFWGKCTQVLGVGVHSIPVKKLNAQNLVESIRHLTSDAGMHQRATDLGAALYKEDGIDEAISVIQSVVGR